MKITAQDLLQLKVIDGIVPEPMGGAHRDPAAAIKATGDAIARTLAEFDGVTQAHARRQRQDRFMAIGQAI
jgi:acetyl-CoA carboxylase carboxyl transferase subunit alpha